jgi:5-oxoprolinase (ATP-hydrolysing)
VRRFIEDFYNTLHTTAFNGSRILQRTSVSTNIKERLDYSCAMFDQTGGLVANAPHIPVHLGAMQEAVRYQIQCSKSSPLKPGDVLLSNHPACGGLKIDITLFVG